jgi:uncharacterized membrane protein YdbT with pleckstrin-like domain
MAISDIYFMTYIDLTTRLCPYCGENIQADAIKCRFCREFLNTDEARALESGEDPKAEKEVENEEQDGDLLFSGRPSLWGMVSSIIKGAIVIGIAILVAYVHIEDVMGLVAGGSQAAAIAQYRIIVTVGISLSVILTLILKAIRLKLMHYEVSSDRIEYSRGIVDRRVDNIDMFRVVDLKLRRNVFDCIFGVGTVALVTTDKSDPEFVFEKVKDCRKLYDVIKKASLEADRKTGVVHLE